MKKIKITLLLSLLISVAVQSAAQAQMVTAADAQLVAQSWIATIIRERASWGGYDSATVAEVQELSRAGRKVGYFCRVAPVGYIIVSLRKELEPIKAYSDRTTLDPLSEEGMADLLKGKMAGMLDRIERQVGPISMATTTDVLSLVEIDYTSSWEQLLGGLLPRRQPAASGEHQLLGLSYQSGQILLTSDWHQFDPYNRQCPAPPGGDDCTDAHCTVGCTALAGAQVMRYWAWPPYRSPGSPYSWTDMPDAITGGSPQVQINAVARLCHEIGIECGSDYCVGDSTTNPCATGACFSSCLNEDLLDTFEDHFWYSYNADDYDRKNYEAVAWFEKIKAQINQNLPVPYTVTNHVIVCDGWQEIGPTPIRQYHMNYGWMGTADDTWYTLDALNLGNPDEEKMLENIYPNCALAGSISGSYGGYFWYFIGDTLGASAVFTNVSHVQFLPRVSVKATGSIEFTGSLGANSRLCSISGTTSAGARIYNGKIKLGSNGGIKFH